MNLGFRLYFPILKKENSDKLLCFFNKKFGDFFKSIRSVNFGKIVGNFANFNITKLKKKSLICSLVFKICTWGVHIHIHGPQCPGNGILATPMCRPPSAAHRPPFYAHHSRSFFNRGFGRRLAIRRTRSCLFHVLVSHLVQDPWYIPRTFEF
jgi:hypothetical protein